MGRMKLRPTKRSKDQHKGPLPEDFLASLLTKVGIEATPENVAAMAGELAQPPPDGDFSKVHTPAMKALIARVNAEDDAKG